MSHSVIRFPKMSRSRKRRSSPGKQRGFRARRAGTPETRTQSAGTSASNGVGWPQCNLQAWGCEVIAGLTTMSKIWHVKMVPIAIINVSGAGVGTQSGDDIQEVPAAASCYGQRLSTLKVNIRC